MCVVCRMLTEQLETFRKEAAELRLQNTRLASQVSSMLYV